ncbi:three-Cys-motif partner protein TcmP [Micromonospora sp. NPDC050417]|uniref:three-Cys-motif partner protein TcmP n=1 Tax=Micromonospora sp. NPDC050417 TaxID=3364280 RepID=UPI00378EA2CE
MSFFDEKQPAAILKHAIINQYIDPFVGKTGRYSLDNRVAVIDGYAGEGRYDSGDEASPALLIRKAHELRRINRTLESYFVESDPKPRAKLQQVIANEGQGLPVQLFAGSIEDHLENLLTLVKGIPLLAFLDPFGLMIPFETTANIFAQRPIQPPATELLINFNASGLRRMAGLLTSTKENRGRESSLARMDASCGGSWWQQVWLDHGDDRDAAEEAVVAGYAERLADSQRCGWWTTPVRNRASHKPVYHLVFLTRHADGFSEFGEALSRGLSRWREALHKDENADTLFGDEAAFKLSEQALAEGWVNEIERNLRRLLAEGKPFKIYSRYAEVYGGVAGQARETHLRAAWKRLYPDVTKTDSKGDLIKKVIEPA